jgi:hypothetical protein
MIVPLPYLATPKILATRVTKEMRLWSSAQIQNHLINLINHRQLVLHMPL